MATSVHQGLTSYAANQVVENVDKAMRRLFNLDPDNLFHTILYAVLLTFLVVIFSRLIDDFFRRDEKQARFYSRNRNQQ